ncbi:uncharacterized protein LOC131223670 [Magnolia sinica]|uniref:uncharacterized protein LOC131223670 n=1 Tax=Magnolia sinica TaxID=86752 RepID=UPI00265ABA79|nr:uncharacterized protein LOC131223670 [Magnolia sinica]
MEAITGGRVRSTFIIPGSNRTTCASYGYMRWWVHQSYLVNKCLPVTEPIWISPPKLKGRRFEEGIGFVPERSHPPFPGQLCRRISLEEPIRERKPANTLEEWIAHGVITDFEKVPQDSSNRVVEDVTEVPCPVQEDVATIQGDPVLSPLPQPTHPSSSYPMTRSRSRSQASPPLRQGVVNLTSPVSADKNLQLGSNKISPSKGKQVVIEDIEEEETEGENSPSSFGSTASIEYDTEENDEGGDGDDDFEEGEVNIDDEDVVVVEGVSTGEEHLSSVHQNIEIEASPAADIPTGIPTAIEEEDEPLDYGEYGFSPSDTPPEDLPPAAPSVPTRISLATFVAPRVVARGIVFPTEPTDLPTPTTIDSSIEARAPSFADILGPDPSSIKETCSPTAQILAEAVYMFKDPDQCLDLNIAVEVLDTATKMAKINVSPLRDSLLRFRDSITALKSAENIAVAPEVLEYGRRYLPRRRLPKLLLSSPNMIKSSYPSRSN